MTGPKYRGPKYRALSAALLDNPGFQELTSFPRWVYAVLTCTLGPSGIEERYPRALVEELAPRAGGSPKKVAAALDELERKGWIRREGRIIWCVRQLEYDPHLKPGGDAMKSILAHLDTLPAGSLTDAYRQYYREWLTEGESQGGTLPPSHPQTLRTPPAHPVNTGRGEEGEESRENGKGKEKREAPVRGVATSATRPLTKTAQQRVSDEKLLETSSPVNSGPSTEESSTEDLIARSEARRALIHDNLGPPPIRPARNTTR